MLAELKDLVQKGLFTQVYTIQACHFWSLNSLSIFQTEVKRIMQKRTAFETALVRRAPKKGDFLRYAAYEMGLEALRKKRVQRLSEFSCTCIRFCLNNCLHDIFSEQGPSPSSISDYALVRRQFHIFERALKKFKGDVGLWIQYAQIAQKEGARALVGRITARYVYTRSPEPMLTSIP